MESFSKQSFSPGKDAEFLMKYFLAIAIHIALEYTAAFEIFCMNTWVCNFFIASVAWFLCFCDEARFFFHYM